MMNEAPTPPQPSRRLPPWLIVLIALAVLGAVLFLVFRPGGPGAPEPTPPPFEVDNPDAQTTFRIPVDASDLSQVEGLDPGWQNILLLGTDGWHGKLNDGRSDAMLVLSVHEESGQVKLTSLVRDMLVPIPGASRGDKINAANAYGGPLLAVKTVNELLGLNISRYLSINFAGFTNVVDLLGGVPIVLSEGEAGIVQAEQTDAPQRLKGWQALEYVRIRKLDNNFGRNQRQRTFLTAMLEQARQQDRGTLMAAFSESMRHLTTNLTAEELFTLLRVGLDQRMTLTTLSLPVEGKFSYGSAPNGVRGVTFHEESLRQTYHEFLYGNPGPLAQKAP